MQQDIKGLVHRSTGTSVTYTLTWTAGTTIGGIVLPATNLNSDATIRVRCYSATSGGSVLADSGTIYACPGANLEAWNWSGTLNANSFAYGGISKSSVWFTNQQHVYRLEINLVNTAPTTYIDCSRIVCGRYWEPTRNVQNGSLQIESADLSTSERTDSGDLLATRSVLVDKLRLDLQYIEEADRQEILRIAKLAGKSRNVAVTVFPDNTNSVLAQDTTIYGKFTNYQVTQQFYGFYSLPLEIEGW
jgi:hypothetical protein